MGDGVLFHPQTTIGAQDLMVIDGLTHYGFLRKYGKLERIIQSASFLKYVFREVAKWRQKFVVLSKGCLYIYKDEFSTSPFQCQSLRGYDRVARLTPTEPAYYTRNGFKVHSEGQPQRKCYIFTCPTDGDRKTWMKMMKKEIKLANLAKPEEQEDDVEIEDEYIALECRVYYKEYPEPTPKKGKRPAAPLPKEVHEQDSDDEDDYDKVDDIRRPPTHRSLPALPTTPIVEHDYKNSKKQKPAVANKPKKQTGSISKEEFEFQGSDRDQVQTLLRDKTDGTFLVRESRTSSSEKVLAVQTDDGVKEYKIYVKGNQLSIDNKTYFSKVEELLLHYRTNNLPNRATSLTRGYSHQDLRVT